MPDHQESTVTATPPSLASPRTVAEARKPLQMTLATELNPHEAVPGG
jgi:hypothetical protein